MLHTDITLATARPVLAGGPNKSAKALRVRVVDGNGRIWARQTKRGLEARRFKSHESAQAEIDKAVTALCPARTV